MHLNTLSTNGMFDTYLYLLSSIQSKVDVLLSGFTTTSFRGGGVAFEILPSQNEAFTKEQSKPNKPCLGVLTGSFCEEGQVIMK